jgi:hypothetical protein
MLTPLIVELLTLCMLMMLIGWAYDLMGYGRSAGKTTARGTASGTILPLVPSEYPKVTRVEISPRKCDRRTVRH